MILTSIKDVYYLFSSALPVPVPLYLLRTYSYPAPAVMLPIGVSRGYCMNGLMVCSSKVLYELLRMSVRF